MIVGDSIQPKATFTVAKVATDPTTVTLRVRRPSGTETSYVYGDDDAIEQESDGVYSASVALDEAGRWAFRWEGTGAVVAAAESILDVRGSAFTTIGEVR